MHLPMDGREFASWTVITKDALTNFEVQLVPGGPWLAATYVQGTADSTGTYNGTVKLLVYGPSWPPVGSGIVADGLGALVSTNCQPRVVCVDTPEDVIRQAGWITLV